MSVTFALYLCFRSLGPYAWNWCVLRSSHTLSVSYGTHAHICVLVWMWVGDLSEGEWPREDVSGAVGKAVGGGWHNGWEQLLSATHADDGLLLGKGRKRSGLRLMPMEDPPPPDHAFQGNPRL